MILLQLIVTNKIIAGVIWIVRLVNIARTVVMVSSYALVKAKANKMIFVPPSMIANKNPAKIVVTDYEFVWV